MMRYKEIPDGNTNKAMEAVLSKLLSSLIDEANLEIPEPEALHERLICAYRSDVFNKLIPLLETGSSALKNNTPLNVAPIKDFLASNWAQIKGTMLSYTALPQDPVTGMLCELAEWLADYLNATAEEKDRPYDDFEKVHRPFCALDLFMPGLFMESMKDNDFPHLLPIKNPETETWDYDLKLKDIIRTHILSDNAQTLLPVSLLLAKGDFIKADANSLNIENPYYNNEYDANANAGQANAAAQQRVSHPYLSEQELERLFQHSSETVAVNDALQVYLTHRDKSASLLGELSHLLKSLQLSSVNGVGAEKNAGQMIYPALAKFETFYTDLTNNPRIKAQIPEAVADEIDTLFTVSPKVNVMETCTATRRNALAKVVQEHEETLGQITLSQEQEDELLSKRLEDYGDAVQALEGALSKSPDENTQYYGSDASGLTQGLLDKFEIQLAFSSLAEMTSLLRPLSGEELRSLLVEVNTQRKIIETITTLENLIILVTDMPLRLIAPLFKGLGDEITKLVSTGEDLGTLLMVNEPDKQNAILEGMRVILMSIIKLGYDFRQVLEDLSPEQRTAVYESLKDRLPEIIQSGDDFGRVLEYLSPEQRTVVYESLKEKLPEIIKSGYDFGQVLQYLSQEQRTAVFESMKETLPQIIQSGEDFRQVLRHLSREQCTVVCESMKDSLPEIIKSAFGFRQVLEYLFPEQCAAVCESMKDRLSEIIKSAFGFRQVLEYLFPEQCAAVCESMKDRLSQIIQSGEDFRQVLRHLSPEQCTAVCESLKEKLPEIIRSGYDFGQVLRHLSPEQCAAVCESMKDRLSQIIQPGEDFRQVLRHLSREQCAAVCESMKDSLPEIIQSGEDFGRVLEYLSQEQRKAVYESMKGTLPEIIWSGKDFGQVLRHLSPEQCTAVCESMKDSLSEIIQSGDDFSNALFFLSGDQKIALCNTLKENGYLCITSIEEKAISRTKKYLEKRVQLNETGKSSDGETPSEVIKRILKPLSSTFERMKSGHWNTKGENLVMPILEAAETEGTTKDSLLELIVEKLKLIDAQASAPSLLWGSTVKHDGQTAMSLMQAYEILGRSNAKLDQIHSSDCNSDDPKKFDQRF